MKFLFVFMIIVFASLCFSAPPDSLGIVGETLIKVIEKIPFIGQNAGAVYGIIATGLGYLLTMLIQLVLKKLPTKWKFNSKLRDIAVGWVWKLLAWLFGKSVLYYNMKVETDKEKALAVAKAKEHFKKHDPLLSIDLSQL